MERIISVKGHGKLEIEPDLIVINMNITSDNKDYDNLILEEKLKYESLVSNLKTVGIEEKNIKTLSYNIISLYNNQLIDNNYKNVFIGYRGNHYLKIELILDMNLLNKVIGAINKSIANPDLNITFTVRNLDFYKEVLILKAIKNATDIANVIAKETDVSIGKIKEIKYGNQTNNFTSQTRFDISLASKEAVNFTPASIDVSEEINMTWFLNQTIEDNKIQL